MMPSFFDLLLAYGFAFGAMNKVDFPRKVKFFDSMLNCSYCTGFHAGWIAWLLTRFVHGFEATAQFASSALLWALCSAAFCYVLDTATQAAERLGQPGENPEA
jgi:hypothetical protein